MPIWIAIIDMGAGRKQLSSKIRWSLLQHKYSLHKSKSLNQVSTLAALCISPFSLSRGFLPGHSIGPISSVPAPVTHVSCSSNRKGSRETFLQFLSILWLWKPTARAPFPLSTSWPKGHDHQQQNCTSLLGHSIKFILIIPKARLKH